MTKIELWFVRKSDINTNNLTYYRRHVNYQMINLSCYIYTQLLGTGLQLEASPNVVLPTRFLNYSMKSQLEYIMCLS